jgi:uncharacterized repeat protein (TIGR02543 family)
MMKKLVTFMLAVVMVATLLPTQAFAANPYQDYDRIYSINKKLVDNERTDEYALDYFSFSSSVDWASIYPEQAKVVEEITRGITDDYAKAEAIADWVHKNMTYDTSKDADGSLRAAGIPDWLRGSCEAYTHTAQILFRLAGFPAKSIVGTISEMGGQPHAWNHVFVDGRWVFADTTYGYFDMPLEDYSNSHKIGKLPDTDWDGTLKIIDSKTRETIDTVGPLPIHTPLTKIPVYASAKLYTDLECTKPVDPKTWKFDFINSKLYTKTYRVSFEIQLDNAYKSLVPHYVREDEYGDLYAYITVPEGAKLPQVKLPEKAGYTFIGWRDLNNSKAPIWNEYTDKVTKDMSFVAVFQKGTVNYTVSFNTNGGSAVKAATVKANTKVTKPANPTKSGYKFTGWYLDKNCTEAWDFSKHIVRRNTTLYAGWEKVITANPTSSKVLVNGKAVTFEAYTINGNNYFKLRDFAQAVNKTEKNFEVKWDSKNNAINLISNKPYTPVGGELAKGDGKAKVANPTTSKIYKDGKEISLTAYTINGNNYFKLRDIAKAFNIGVTWDGTTNTIGIDTSIGYVEE